MPPSGSSMSCSPGTKKTGSPSSFSIWSASSNSSSRDSCETSPVWMTKSGRCRQRLHLGDRLAKGGARVGIGRLVEADMAVADLREGEGERSRSEAALRAPHRGRSSCRSRRRTRTARRSRPMPCISGNHGDRRPCRQASIRPFSVRYSDAMTGDRAALFPTRRNYFSRCLRESTVALSLRQGGKDMATISRAAPPQALVDGARDHRLVGGHHLRVVRFLHFRQPRAGHRARSSSPGSSRRRR